MSLILRVQDKKKKDRKGYKRKEREERIMKLRILFFIKMNVV
jgi:hypothetical protein